MLHKGEVHPTGNQNSAYVARHREKPIEARIWFAAELIVSRLAKRVLISHSRQEGILSVFGLDGWQNVISLKAVFEFLEQRGKRGKLSESVAGTALSHICARTPIDEVAAEFAESANQILASQYLDAKLVMVRIAGATVWPVMVDRV